MALTKVIGAGVEGLTLSTTDLKIDAGDLIFSTANKGVVIGATSNTDANTLDDYEEGTWTAVIKSSGGTSLTTVNTGTYYNKVGKLVNVWFYIKRTDSSTPGGDLNIAGLPFTSKSSNYASMSGSLWMDNNTTTDRRNFIYLGANSTEAVVLPSGTTDSRTSLSEAENNRFMYGIITYLTD